MRSNCALSLVLSTNALSALARHTNFSAQSNDRCLDRNYAVFSIGDKRTHVDVVWQDGTLESKIPATTVRPFLHYYAYVGPMRSILACCE